MTGGALDWVAPACVVLLGERPSLTAVRDWLGVVPEPVGRRAHGLPRGVPPGTAGLRIRTGGDGVLDHLVARFPPGEEPTVAEAEAVLGPGREAAPAIDGPFRVHFTRPESAFATCLVSGSTWDPPGGERRLVEILVRRDPPAGA